MRKLKLVESLIIIILFGVGIYIFTQNQKVSISPVSDRDFAEQAQISIYEKQAVDLSDDKLISELIEGLTALNTENYDINLGFQMNAYIREYDKRKLNHPVIDELANSLFEKLGPCWGIPEGQCRE